MKNNRAVGSRYEQIAALSLRGQGYRILERNYKRPTGEIDLIAQEGDCLVFIEVKFRSGQRMGSPEAAVGAAKQRRIYRTAQYYMAEKKISQTQKCRFDVVAVEGTEIRIRRNAFGEM